MRLRLSFLVFVLVAASSLVTFADSIHIVAPKETVWFIAKLYYGDGNKFNEIMFANQMKKPTDLTVGEELVVPLPKYSNHQPEFQQRYISLIKERETLLAKQRALAAHKVAHSQRTPASSDHRQ